MQLILDDGKAVYECMTLTSHLDGVDIGTVANLSLSTLHNGMAGSEISLTRVLQFVAPVDVVETCMADSPGCYPKNVDDLLKAKEIEVICDGYKAA